MTCPRENRGSRVSPRSCVSSAGAAPCTWTCPRLRSSQSHRCLPHRRQSCRHRRCCRHPDRPAATASTRKNPTNWNLDWGSAPGKDWGTACHWNSRMDWYLGWGLGLIAWRLARVVVVFVVVIGLWAGSDSGGFRFWNLKNKLNHTNIEILSRGTIYDIVLCTSPPFPILSVWYVCRYVEYLIEYLVTYFVMYVNTWLKPATCLGLARRFLRMAPR